MTFAGRRRVKIDPLFCAERVNNQFLIHKRYNFYWVKVIINFSRGGKAYLERKG